MQNWPGHDGEVYTVASRFFDRLMWRAAIEQARAWDRFKARSNGSQVDEAQLELFKPEADVD